MGHCDLLTLESRPYEAYKQVRTPYSSHFKQVLNSSWTHEVIVAPGPALAMHCTILIITPLTHSLCYAEPF